MMPELRPLMPTASGGLSGDCEDDSCSVPKGKGKSVLGGGCRIGPPLNKPKPGFWLLLLASNLDCCAASKSSISLLIRPDVASSKDR